MNTHYALAAIFALGLRGIEKKIQLPYGPLGSPGVTRESVKHLPTDLHSAMTVFARPNSVAREVFGDEFVDHYAGTREHELEVFKRSVTDWESEYFRVARANKLQRNVILSWYNVCRTMQILTLSLARLIAPSSTLCLFWPIRHISVFPLSGRAYRAGGSFPDGQYQSRPMSRPGTFHKQWASPRLDKSRSIYHKRFLGQ